MKTEACVVLMYRYFICAHRPYSSWMLFCSFWVSYQDVSCIPFDREAHHCSEIHPPASSACDPPEPPDICLSLEPGDPSLLLPPRGHVVQEELLNGTERPDQPLLALILL